MIRFGRARQPVTVRSLERGERVPPPPTPCQRKPSSWLPALAEAARADRRTAGRFVPPRTGILEETAARRHQFVFGRCGVGKSTLQRKIESLEGTGTTSDGASNPTWHRCRSAH